MPRLLINPDSTAAWEIQIQPGTYSLGRNAENDVPLDHPSVSSAHAQLVVSDTQASLKDLGSTSGSFVDGQLVEQVNLRPGQTFFLGEVQLRFESETQPTPVEPPLPPRVPAATDPKQNRGATSIAAAMTRYSPLLAPAAGHEPRFAAQLAEAFLYPFKGDGVVLLVAGSIFYALIGAVGFFAAFGGFITTGVMGVVGILGTGYLVAYLRRILVSSAMGEQAMPDWPDLTDLWSDILSPFLQLVATALACAVPVFIVAFFVSTDLAGRSWALVTAYLFGCAYFPMAYLAVSMFDTITAVNPLLVVPSIVKVPWEYMLTILLLAGVLAVRWAGEVALATFLPIPFLPGLISSFLGLYLMVVEVRILGLLYFCRKTELGWYTR